MKLVTDYHAEEMKTITTIEITDQDMAKAGFYEFDHEMMRSCNESDKVSDRLLALELIARRIEDQANAKP